MDNQQKVKVIEIKPQYYAQECPVCNGFGSLRHGIKVCQGCEGKGYVLVPTGEMDGNERHKT